MLWVVLIFQVTAPTTVTRGTSASFSSAIKNQGGPAGSFTVTFYLSKDNVINTSDTLLGTVTVPSLGGGSTTTVSGSFTVPTSIANAKYFVGVVVDSGSAIAETNETNNTKATGSSISVK
jgi:subtilase family serine protease